MPDDPGPKRNASDTTQLFNLLANSRRRALLRILDSSAQSQAIADVARTIAKDEQDQPSENVSHEEVKRIHTALCHAHIPKLTDANVITHEKDGNTVELTDHGEQVCIHLQRLTEQMDQIDPDRRE